MNKKRNATIELLRIISMILIITLHAADKGGVLELQYGMGNNVYIPAWILEAFAIFGLNMYVMIAGYYMVGGKFKTGRLLEIICTILFYSVGIFALCKLRVIPTEGLTTYDYLKNLFPVHMETYWFCTAYVVLYLFMPVLARGVKAMSQKGLVTTIILLLIFETAFKSVLPFRFEIDDKGYSALWFLILFLVSAYIKLYGIKFFNNVSRGVITYCVCAVLVAAEEIALQVVVNKTGHLGVLHMVSYEHNHIFMVLGSIGLFTAFINAKPIYGKVGNVISFFAKGAFGVYLIHEHDLVKFKWPGWLGVNRLTQANPLVYIPAMLAIALCVYIVCALLDQIRIFLFTLIKKVFKNTKLVALMAGWDKTLNGETD